MAQSRSSIRNSYGPFFGIFSLYVDDMVSMLYSMVDRLMIDVWGMDMCC